MRNGLGSPCNSGLGSLCNSGLGSPCNSGLSLYLNFRPYPSKQMTPRQKMLFRMLLLHIRYRIWSRRPVCNIDLITLEPIADADAFELMDTHERCIYRFHRSNMYKSIITNLGTATTMIAEPRAPTNPYTNNPLTLAQTISVCKRLAATVPCPHPFFAAFWAARFDIQRFHTENIAALSQHAITSYFDEFNVENVTTIHGTVKTLLTYTNYLVPEPSEWMGPFPFRDDWRKLCRDYFIFVNLHVLARPHWSSNASIFTEAWTLAERSGFSHVSQGIMNIMQFFMNM